MDDHLTTPPMSLDTARKMIRNQADSAFAHAAGLVLHRLEEVETNISMGRARYAWGADSDYAEGWLAALSYALPGELS